MNLYSSFVETTARFPQKKFFSNLLEGVKNKLVFFIEILLIALSHSQIEAQVYSEFF